MSDQTRIDWCDATINPWGWGCYGPGGTAEKPAVCWYCYARRLASRKLRSCPDCQGFRPHWHPEELDKPLEWKKPRRIFVQSMGDPFGDWVEPQQIDDALDVMGSCPQHTFLMLTKQPQNILRLLPALPVPNLWLGTSMDGQTKQRGARPWVTGGIYLKDVQAAGWHTFISAEPLLGFIAPFTMQGAQWVIIGAYTGPGAAKHAPRREWVERIITDCDERRVPVFLKPSITKQWPDLTRREWPEEMRRC